MKYLKIWTSFREVIEPLSDAEKGRLFDMMLLYADCGTEPAEFAGNERFTWPAAKQMLDRMIEENARLAENGKKGGRPKNQQKPTETNENQLKPTESQKENKRKEKERNEIKESLFERFWAVYPRKVAKPDAKRKFLQLDPDEQLLSEMIRAVEAQKQSEQWTKDGGQFIPHPATWINQRRWEDDMPAVKPSVKVLPVQQYSQRNYAGEQEEALRRMLEMG